MSNINEELSSVEENITQILNDIQSLQVIEQELFSSLEENTGLTRKQQQDIIKKINNISKMRVNLYKTINKINNFFQNSLSNSKGTLIEQTAAIDIIEKELNNSKKKLESLEDEKNNKIRLVEINQYYGQKYAEHSDLMKIIIIMLIPIVILIVLFNKGIIPSNIYYFLILLIIIIGLYYISKIIVSIILRDNMDYQKYDWHFDPNTANKSIITKNNVDPWASKMPAFDMMTCIGDDCCSDGLVYDSNLNKCITSTKEQVEPFVNNIFTKLASVY